jgi:dephospho-CoA kinase
MARVLVIDCSEDVQISRVMARSGLSADEVRAIMATQASRAERLAAADDVLLNDGDLDRLRAQLDVLHERYLAMARMASTKCRDT